MQCFLCILNSWVIIKLFIFTYWIHKRLLMALVCTSFHYKWGWTFFHIVISHLWTSFWPPVMISSTGLFVSAHFLYMKDIYNSLPDTGILNIFSKLALLLIFCKRRNFIFSWSDLFLWILSFGLHSDKASRTSLVVQW